MNKFQDVYFRVWSDEDSQLVVSSDIREPDHLMILMRGNFTDTPGVAIVLDAVEVKELETALKSKQSLRIQPTSTRSGLSVRLANRGEPYRSGMEISLVAQNSVTIGYEEISMFLEKGPNLEMLANFVAEQNAGNASEKGMTR